MSLISSLSPAAVTAPPIEAVLLVERFVRRSPAFRFEATSLPGHLLHYVVSGRVRQQCNGREYELRPGCVMWYHEDEWVTGQMLESPWVFYSVNFIAPGLPPPPFEGRLIPDQRRLAARFARLHATWHAPAPARFPRQCRVHARLLDILAGLATPATGSVRIDPRAQLWWALETELRRDLALPVTLARMCRISGASAATIARACRYAVGQPPLRRIKQVRISLARGLVRQSGLAMKEIAARTGYGRVHEFSRDYHRHVGCSPTQDRKRAPAADYAPL